MLITKQLRALKYFTLAIFSFLFIRVSANDISDKKLKYIENRGQWNAAVKYKTDFNRGAVFLEEKGFTFLIRNKKDLQKSIFNTAQIIIGLYSRYSNTNNIIYLESGIKASNWLASCINENGFFDRN